jgi:hypothetical protein
MIQTLSSIAKEVPLLRLWRVFLCNLVQDHAATCKVNNSKGPSLRFSFSVIKEIFIANQSILN